MQDCDGCQRVAAAALQKNEQLIAEFANSFLFLGDHQYYEGYCVLMAKRHVRELHELAPKEFSELMDELMRSTRAVHAAFQPWKMNHACLGNAMPHIHWHMMPRYENDPDRFHNPWFKMNDFDTKVPDEAGRKERILRIQKHLLD